MHCHVDGAGLARCRRRHGTLCGFWVKAYEAPRMLAYSAPNDALFGLCTQHLGVVTCEPHPDGGTVICWQAYGKLARNPVRAWGGRKLFQVALSNGMKNLERKFAPR